MNPYPTWKWVVGVLVLLVTGLASITYATVDRRITDLESDRKTTVAEVYALRQEVAVLRQEVNDKLDILLGDKPYVRKP